MKDYDFKEFQITGDDEDKRLDVFLNEKLADLSRSHIQKLIGENYVSINNKTPSLNKNIKANYKIKVDDVVKINIPQAKPLETMPENISLDILYEDSDIIVVNKPRGMVVHPAAGNYEGTLVNALLNHCKDLSGINGILRPGIVHRLDKDTSGVMVAAKSDAAHLNLAEQIKSRTASRKYIAIVKGFLPERQGIINAPIGRHTSDRKKMAVTFKASKEAITNFSVLKYYIHPHRGEKYTLIECKLQTGRTHQIRVHLFYIGYPVLGDLRYGGRTNFFGISGQALHSSELKLLHPISKEELIFKALLPQDMQEILKVLEEKE